MLFQAVSRCNHFQELKIYYFHNAPEEYLYTDPTLKSEYQVPTRRVLAQCDPSYRVIVVGDAYVIPRELTYVPATVTYENMGLSSLDWLELIQSRYPSHVWLNPCQRPPLHCVVMDAHISYDKIASPFPMYRLTLAGLERAMKKLLVRN